ncbi:LysR family transcriptional regulator [Acetobacter persici]|uniref:LysR family transcriptional regulator n=1 Tax=Acetobacter persici TaxID=1076596 RepID=UPI0039EC2993
MLIARIIPKGTDKMLSVLPRSSDLTDREIFLCFCYCGTLSKAAAILDTHPSKISRAIKYLEHKLDTQLVQRNGKKLVLTREGEHYRDSITQAFKEILAEEYILKKKIFKKTIKIYYQNIPGRLFMENVLNNCIIKFPNITIDYEIMPYLTSDCLKDNCVFIGNGRNTLVPEDTIRKNIYSDSLLIGSSIENPEIKKGYLYNIEHLYDKKIINCSSYVMQYLDDTGISHDTNFRNILLSVGQSVDSIKFGVQNKCLFMTCHYCFHRTSFSDQVLQIPIKEKIDYYYIDIFYNQNTRDNAENKMVIDYLYREARAFFSSFRKTLPG